MHTYEAPQITTIGSLRDMTLASFDSFSQDNLHISIDLPGPGDININVPAIGNNNVSLQF
jgi:hypothetical protein